MTKRDIDSLIKNIIPPQTHDEREGFSNKEIISKLNSDEKIEVENRLNAMLQISDDSLIGQTLVMLKSKRSVSIMKEKLVSGKSPIEKIMWASFINEIEGENNEMKHIALTEFDKATKNDINVILLYHLSTFGDDEINEKIGAYVVESDSISMSYVKQFLGDDVLSVIDRLSVKRPHRKQKKLFFKISAFIISILSFLFIVFYLIVRYAFGPIHSSGSIPINQHHSLEYEEIYNGDFAGVFYDVTFYHENKSIGKYTFHYMDWKESLKVDSNSNRRYLRFTDFSINKESLIGYYMLSYDSNFLNIRDSVYNDTLPKH